MPPPPPLAPLRHARHAHRRATDDACDSPEASDRGHAAAGSATAPASLARNADAVEDKAENDAGRDASSHRPSRSDAIEQFTYAMGSTPIRNGNISVGEFNASAAALVKRWEQIDVDATLPLWIWKPCRKISVPSEEEGYLALEGVYHLDGGSEGQIDEHINPEGVEIVDDATLVESCKYDAHVYDFHIIYSFCYRVPVLYFRGYQSDGHPLTLHEIKQDLPPHSLKILSESKWTFITQEEHPHLNRPWYTLHPCGTSDWMKLLLDDTKSAGKVQLVQYLPAWLSVVGQAVGLRIPMGIYCNP